MSRRIRFPKNTFRITIDGEEVTLLTTFSFDEEGAIVEVFGPAQECVDISKHIELLSDAFRVSELVTGLKRLRRGSTLTDLAAAVESNLDDAVRTQQLAGDFGVSIGELETLIRESLPLAQ